MLLVDQDMDTEEDMDSQVKGDMDQEDLKVQVDMDMVEWYFIYKFKYLRIKFEKLLKLYIFIYLKDLDQFLKKKFVDKIYIIYPILNNLI